MGKSAAAAPAGGNYSTGTAGGSGSVFNSGTSGFGNYGGAGSFGLGSYGASGGMGGGAFGGGYGGGMPGMGGGGFGYGGLGNLQDASLFSGGTPGSLSDTNANIGGQLGPGQGNDQNGLNAYAQASPQEAAQAAGSPADQTSNALEQLMPPQGPGGFSNTPVGNNPLVGGAPSGANPVQTQSITPIQQEGTGNIAPPVTAADFNAAQGNATALGANNVVGQPDVMANAFNPNPIGSQPLTPTDTAEVDNPDSAYNQGLLRQAQAGNATPIQPTQVNPSTQPAVPASTANAASNVAAQNGGSQNAGTQTGGATNHPIHQALGSMGFNNPMQRLLGDFFSALSGHGNPMQLLQDLISMLSGGAMGLQGQDSGMLQPGQSVNWRGRHLRYLGNGRFVDDRGDIIDGNSGQVVGHQGGGNGRAPATDPSNPPGTQANPTPIRT